VPSSAVHQDYGVRLWRNMAADFVEVHLHGLSVRFRQHQCRTNSTLGTDGTEQIGILVALVGRLTGPRTLLCPLSHESVLLAKSCLVLKPYLDRRVFW